MSAHGEHEARDPVRIVEFMLILRAPIVLIYGSHDPGKVVLNTDRVSRVDLEALFHDVSNPVGLPIGIISEEVNGDAWHSVCRRRQIEVEELVVHLVVVSY